MQETNFITEWLAAGTIMSADKGRVLLGWGERRWLPSPDLNSSLPQFYFPDYFLKEKSPWCEHPKTLEISLRDLLSLLPPSDKIAHKPYNWQNTHKQLFSDTFHQLKQRFEKGELSKAVPFVSESAATAMNSDILLTSLRSAVTYALNNPTYLYGFWSKHEGILGATPEVLFQLSPDGSLETMACAGTKRTAADPLTFLNDPKEQQEHQLVIQGITESLSPYGKVFVETSSLLNLPHLTHLVTPIKIKLSTVPNIEELVRALHPTPAVGTFPRKAGMKWLHEYQGKLDRRRFGAPAGYLIPLTGQSCCYVAIRNVQWNETQMEIAAGCGVVRDSLLENEWAEINLKLNAIKDILAL